MAQIDNATKLGIGTYFEKNLKKFLDNKNNHFKNP